jgi:hypothetical protein
MGLFRNHQRISGKDRERKLRRERYFRLWGYKACKRYRIGERIAGANLWADAHRKKTAALLMGAMLLIILASLTVDFLAFSGKGPDPIEEPDMTSLKPMFDGMHSIMTMKTLESNELTAMANRTIFLKRDIDSLLALPAKTHEDSVRTVGEYAELKSILTKIK